MYKSEREEKLLEQLLERYQTLGIVIWGQIEGAPGTYAKILVKSDGTVKVEGVVTISGSVDVSDRWARQLGQVDIQRYLGAAIGVANPLHSQVVVSGAVIDPRSIRALTSSDIITVYGSQTQALLQRATTYDLIVQLRSAGIEIDPRSRTWNLSSSDVPDISDRAARLLGKVYGNVGLLGQMSIAPGIALMTVPFGSQYAGLQQRATSSDLYVAIRQAGSELSTSNPIHVAITDGVEMLAIDTSSRAEVTPYQATRTNLLAKPEREDLISLGGVASPSAAGVQIIAGTAGQKIKVYDAGYHAGADGLHYFYFGTTTTATTKRLCTLNKALPVHKTFVQPRVGDAGDSLYIYSSVAETNMPYDVGYVKEA